MERRDDENVRNIIPRSTQSVLKTRLRAARDDVCHSIEESNFYGESVHVVHIYFCLCIRFFLFFFFSYLDMIFFRLSSTVNSKTQEDTVRDRFR